MKTLIKNISELVQIENQIRKWVSGSEMSKIDTIKDGFIDIFIMPPSIKVLEMRLRNRKTNTEESIKKRLIEAENEIKKSKDFQHVIINDNLEFAFSELCNIIDSF